MGAPGADVDISVDLVRALLEEQHPDLAELPIREHTHGWDNAIFRLGDDLTVRLPRRLASAILVLNEQRWLPEVAVDLPLPVPVPVRVGRPGCGYDWSWTVAPWFPGLPAEHTPPDDLEATAETLGEFLASLHRPAPADAPSNPFRGVPLADRSERLEAGLDELGDTVDQAAVRACWTELVETPSWTGPPVWLHGDMHTLNLLVDAGRLSAVIDFGDITAGDPASDLAVGWMLFPAAPRARFRAATDADVDTWTRARAWALALGVAFANGDERISGIGLRALAAALSDEA